MPTELTKPLDLTVDLEEEPETGRWIAEVVELPGVLVYGTTAFEALAKAKLLAIDVIGDRLANGEDPLTGCELGEACPPFEARSRLRRDRVPSRPAGLLARRAGSSPRSKESVGTRNAP